VKSTGRTLPLETFGIIGAAAAKLEKEGKQERQRSSPGPERSRQIGEKSAAPRWNNPDGPAILMEEYLFILKPFHAGDVGGSAWVLITLAGKLIR
jgi:hypothetical protein